MSTTLQDDPTAATGAEAGSGEEKLTLKVLVAEDEPVSRRVIQSILEREGHECVVVANGEEAVQAFVDSDPDLVLMDIQMPVMNGFDATRKIREICGDRFVPIIFLTAAEGSDRLMRCIDVGGDDFLSKPVNRIMLQAKIAAFNRIRQLSLIQAEQNEVLRQHNLETQEELAVAEQVFKKITSLGSLDVQNLRFKVSPASLFNGDMLLADRTPQGGLRVLVGDFTGHGLPAAVGAVPVSEIFYAMTRKGCSLGDLAVELNERMRKMLPLGVFCAACLLELDAHGEALEVWTGGLPGVEVVTPKDGLAERIPSDHLAFGVAASDAGYASTQHITCVEGMKVYCHTDGIVEAENCLGEMFGDDRLADILAASAEAGNGFIATLEALADHTDGMAQADDITLLEFDCSSPPPPVEGEGQKKSNRSAKATDFKLVAEFRPDALRQVDSVPLLMHGLKELGVPDDEMANLFTILAELTNNSVDHGLLELDSSLKADAGGFARYYALKEERLGSLDDGFVRIELEQAPTEEGGVLSIVVEDTGRGYDHESLLTTLAKADEDQDAGRLHGRGMILVHSLAERLEIEDDGRRIHLDYRWCYS